MHSRAFSRQNRGLRHLRWGANRVRYLTEGEVDGWFERLRQIHETRCSRSTLVVRAIGREFVVNRGTA